MRTALLTVLVLAGVATTATAQGSLERVHGRLIVEVSGATDGVTITVDGLLLPRDRWGVPTRVELGTHVVAARRNGEVVSSSETVVPRGGDAHVELVVTPPRAVTQGPLRIEPASRPSAMAVDEGEPDEASTVDRYDPTEDQPELTDEEPAATLVEVDGGEGAEDDDSEGIPSWVYWGAGGVVLAVLIIVISVAAADSGGRPVEGDLMPGVLRF